MNREHAGRAPRKSHRPARWQLQLAPRARGDLPQYACFRCELKGAPRVDREPHACYRSLYSSTATGGTLKAGEAEHRCWLPLQSARRPPDVKSGP